MSASLTFVPSFLLDIIPAAGMIFLMFRFLTQRRKYRQRERELQEAIASIREKAGEYRPEGQTDEQ